MEKVIACCGLDCATCDARIATLADDNELRAQTAEKWKVQFSPDITPQMINCTGCREAGVKFSHCGDIVGGIKRGSRDLGVVDTIR